MDNETLKDIDDVILKPIFRIRNIMIFLGIGIGSATLLGIGDELDRKYHPPKTCETTYQLFGEDVKITRHETMQRNIFEYRTTGITFDIQINKPGQYSFDAWAARYRAPDKKQCDWDYRVNIPTTFSENPRRVVSRIQAQRVVYGKLEKASQVLDHYEGNTSAGIGKVGDANW
ncbi:MAG: hypothetical protein Q8N99_04040 [Nanoarchaeota archaeon]|nr:hypothetical protein [Nanoarchaeota archaeon]